MNKFMKVLAASALVATALVGCGKSAKYAKVGFGIHIVPGEQTSTTVATVGLDKDGKVQYLDLDCVQAPNGKDETKSKKELGSEYGMKGASAEAGQIKDGAEWDAQAKAFEEWAKGKTLDEIAKVDTMDYHGGKAPKTGTDLAAGCTIVIDDFLAAIDEAGKNAVEVEADKIGAGETIDWDAEKPQKNSTFVSVALDADGKVVWTSVDVSQNPNGKDETKSKKELGSEYGMKGASAAAGQIKDGAEWDAQAKAFEEWTKGKTAEEVAGVELMDYHGGKAAKTGSDLAAGCTMVITDFLSAFDEAVKAAQ
ncbi:MAG: hypothetical protein K2P09_06030 [Erysipelotrichales bacterium]|nr:hypothetical protein [Erysipelotrichales bacterium]